MSRKEKLIAKIMNQAQEKNVTFEELISLVVLLGFSLKNITGSHRVYTKTGIEEIVNLQEGKNGKAKPYQVKEVRKIINERGLK